ncbi:hypothetical protein BDV59DRAFT_187739 [Aspergillus ambiguus]|uniref:fungal specific transcription factor domain-containing protein n=1 Tax=Aspergillus ambiguus TaxID=176160 RepID=UPI003CCD36CC
MELMELGGHIGAILERTQSDMPYVSRQRYFDLAALDRELTTWYSQLRPSLRHTVENARAAPTSFLHLHQQYYSIMISLHSELGMNDFDCLSGTSDNAGSHQVTSLSRLTCITCAGQMAQIFWQQRQRFKTSHMFSTGLQHAGSAASILVMALKSPHRPGSWKTIKTYLDCIFATLKEMTRTYPAAERMVRVLSTIISELSEPGGFPPPECPEHHGTFASESDQETNNMSMEPVISITPNDNLIGDTAEQQIEPNSGLDRPIQPGGSDFDPWTPLSLPSLPGDLETIFPQAADINLSALDVEMISPSLNSSEQREELHGSCSLPHTLGLSEGGNDPLSSCLTDAVGSLETGSYTCFKEPTEWADTGINMYDQYSNLLGITEHG